LFDHPTDEPGWSIMLIDSDGTGMTDRTGQRNACEAQPACNPGGQRIVFERYDYIANVGAVWSSAEHAR
jgi:hypothetical protein